MQKVVIIKFTFSAKEFSLSPQIRTIILKDSTLVRKLKFQYWNEYYKHTHKYVT